MEVIIALLRNGACVIKDLTEFFPDHAFTNMIIKPGRKLAEIEVPYMDMFIGLLQVRGRGGTI